MKKYLISICIIIVGIIVGIGIYHLDNGKKTVPENNINNINNGNNSVISNENDVTTVMTMQDEIKNDTIWCGTFQLIWNDLKNDLVKQDIVFTPQIEVVENLNSELFTTDDLSEEYYYKKVGLASLELKKEIENAIKEKFNETSDILDDFNWDRKSEEDYFLYAMLKKEFKFKKEFEELEKGKFANYEDVEYFGIDKDNESDERRYQVTVLYYNSKDDFAIKIETEQEDEVVFCKNPEGNTFSEIYNNINEQKDRYTGNTEFEKEEILKIPNIKINNKKEFTEIENKRFEFSDGRIYTIEKAMQTVDFELNSKGGKIKSEAGMMLEKLGATIALKPREFIIDDTFAIFLVEEGKENPYFAAKINDITKFQ